MQHEQSVTLGSGDIQISPIGIGTWAWGSRFFWGYGGDYSEQEVHGAFEASLAAGINFFDTAEFYGNGAAEEMLGHFIRQSGRKPVIESKFFPYPWRLFKRCFRRALTGSLRRLGLQRIDVYMPHWPWPPVPIETWVGALADAMQEGLVRAAGVSNYNLAQMRRAQAVLDKRGLALAVNQVQYNLLDRRAERNGLLQACRESNVTLVAYSPLAQGLLTGKYSPDNPPSGIRAQRYRRTLLQELQSLVHLAGEIGQEYGGKTPAQVALNWVMCKGAVPIPGAKNARQARENAAALGWRLTEDQVAALDAASDRVHEHRQDF